jgi:hypothetical protein
MLYEADDDDDETFERRMGNDEDRVLRHRLSAMVRFPETDGADSVD